MNQHISEQFDAELSQIRDRFMEMGGLVESNLRDAVQALLSLDASEAQRVRDLDRRINQLEVEIGELCVHIIALRQPAASDLRTVVSIMRACGDIERIGDETGRIAKMTQALADLPMLPDQYQDFRNMASITQSIVAQSLDAFARNDVDLASAAIDADKPINEAYRALVKERTGQMHADSAAIDQCMNIIWAARSLERIGDHAKNISESLVFLVKGDDVRHSRKK